MYFFDPISAIIAIVGALLTLLILWAVIRNAVRTALRDHQEWLGSGGNPDLKNPPKLS